MNAQINDKALVVDDDPGICEALAAILKGSGYDPLVFQHPQRVLAEVGREPCALAFIDVNLPDMNGLELAAHLQSGAGVDELIFMSGHGTFDNLLGAIKLGASDYLKKPFRGQELKTLFTRISERRRIRKRILETESRHSSLIQNIPLLVFSINPELELEFMNRASSSMLGFAPEEAVGAPGWFVKRVHPGDRRKVREALLQSLRSHSSFSLECRLLHKKGQAVHGILRSIPCSNGNGAQSSRRIEGIFVDITDRVFLEKTLVQQEKLKTLDDISAEMAHEVRNPLTSIAGFARRLEKKAPETPEVGIILRESVRLEKLFNRIRDYLKPVKVNHRPCAVNVLLADCASQLHPELDEKHIWIRTDLDESTPMVLADQDVLTEVILHLVRYAAKCMSRGLILGIKSFEVGNSVHVEISYPDPLQPAADPFFLPFDESGQKVGLPMCYRLIKNMDGLLSFSYCQNESTFILSLKRADAEQPARGLAGPSDQNGRNLSFDCRTGLITRDLFDRLLPAKVRSAVSGNHPLSLIMADIDHFETFAKKHDQNGCLECLANVAQAMNQKLPNPSHLLARYGTQKFAAILPDIPGPQAIQLAESMRGAIFNQAIPHKDSGCSGVLTASFGVSALNPGQGKPAHELITDANQALYLAKRIGRNSVMASGFGLI